MISCCTGDVKILLSIYCWNSVDPIRLAACGLMSEHGRRQRSIDMHLDEGSTAVEEIACVGNLLGIDPVDYAVISIECDIEAPLEP